MNDDGRSSCVRRVYVTFVPVAQLDRALASGAKG